MAEHADEVGRLRAAQDIILDVERCAQPQSGKPSASPASPATAATAARRMNPSRTDAASHRQLPAAASHKILPGRTVQPVNRVAVSVNYISNALVTERTSSARNSRAR